MALLLLTSKTEKAKATLPSGRTDIFRMFLISTYAGQKIMSAKIFHHDIMNCTHEQVTGNHLYSGRTLGLTEKDDLIQLHPQLQPEWKSIVNHYARIGLPHTHNVIWNVSPDNLKKHESYELSVFFFGEDIHQVRPNAPWSQVVNYINSKNNFEILAEKLDMTTPETYCFCNKSAVVFDIEDLPFPCYLKASVSVSGIGIYRCEDSKALKKALADFDDNVPLQVQEEVKTDTFLNVQYRVNGQGLQRWAVTEQLLDGFAHKGNRFPSCHTPWASVDNMAQWLYNNGMQGTFAFDVGVVNEEDSIRYMPIECNPRFNGASYPTGVAFKLGVTDWVHESFKTSHRHLADINLSGIEFDPKTKTGVVLVNWSPIFVGKLGVLIAGSPETQASLRQSLMQRLH